MSSSISEIPRPSEGSNLSKNKSLDRNRPSVKRIGKRKENTTTGMMTHTYYDSYITHAMTQVM